MNKENDLFYVCSLIEYIGRERKLRRGDVVAALGEEAIRRIYRYADTFHCEQIAKVADDFIALPGGKDSCGMTGREFGWTTGNTFTLATM